MTGALIILAVTVIAGVLLYIHHRYTSGSGEDASQETTAPAPKDERTGADECCGRHAVCEKTMPQTYSTLYYDDEELDRFAGTDPESYTDSDIEEFREILYTLRHEEVYSWGAALTRRNITLPLQLRDEWVMLCE